ncbi:hypothetical protein C8R45DRAFT_945735 [Mycena sanguinolenta]|nr:hypothetical protein C8R45DRAFT_945735 [Mycena sanguinolenta]
MHFTNFCKFVFISTALALQAHAASPPIIKGDFEIIEGTTAAPRSRLLATGADIPTIGPFVPTATNLLFNTTVPQNVDANLGWIFDTVDTPNGEAFDGFSKNITVFYTPPNGIEIFVFRRVVSRYLLAVGPTDPDVFCGIFSGFFIEGIIDSSVLGTCALSIWSTRYTGRWVIEYGESTQPDAPIDPTSGCGPLPFNLTTVEFVRTWEVVGA